MVIEDEKEIRDLVRYNLEKAGYRVAAAADGEEGLKQLFASRPDALVLDLMLPGINGLEIVREVRGEPLTHDLPVLILTARSAEMDKLLGFEQGADDYLTKPFSPQELVLRVGAILRRMSAGGVGPSDVVSIGPVTIDRAEHRVAVDGRAIELTPTEYKLLLTLAERRGRVQGRAHLLETVWEAAPDIQTRTVDMHVQRLRTKLGEAGDLIETVRGFGYRLKSNQARRT
jgi:two-component system phosphate regulon response regulator PhoB